MEGADSQAMFNQQQRLAQMLHAQGPAEPPPKREVVIPTIESATPNLDATRKIAGTLQLYQNKRAYTHILVDAARTSAELGAQEDAARVLLTRKEVTPDWLDYLDGVEKNLGTAYKAMTSPESFDWRLTFCLGCGLSCLFLLKLSPSSQNLSPLKCCRNCQML